MRHFEVVAEAGYAPPVSGDLSTYELTVSHSPLSRGYLVRFDIVFKQAGLLATIIVLCSEAADVADTDPDF